VSVRPVAHSSQRHTQARAPHNRQTLISLAIRALRC